MGPCAENNEPRTGRQIPSSPPSYSYSYSARRAVLVLEPRQSPSSQQPHRPDFEYDFEYEFEYEFEYKFEYKFEYESAPSTRALALKLES